MVVAHRLTTTRRADPLLVLNNACTLERGMP
jgi:ABC-type multidrug transport system fused ATPase/permease subunit